MEQYESDVVVIGAGVVGLAIARAFALAGRETFILEKNKHFGMETSARNSEVIHAGIYYPKDSLKARLCVRGRDLLYGFCQSHGVAHKRLGKLIVATHDGQGAQLAAIAAAALANWVGDLRHLSRAESLALEPGLAARESLFSPSTGIIDSHQYMLALLGDAEGAGAQLARDAEVTAVARRGDGYRVLVRNGGEDSALDCRILVNSAGLWAQQVAHRIDALDGKFVPPLFLAKGSYVTLSAQSPFRHLVYPVPEHGGLGVHVTLDMGGGARFGPNVEWLDTNDPAAIDYTVPAGLPALFAPRIADYWPAVTPAMLAPGYSGVRPKLTGPHEPGADFRIEGSQTHGLPGLINLFGIESPGLTSSLAIAEHVESFGMKLGIGTVQFGQAYGISNKGGQVPQAEAAAILARAASAGVGLLDTAANYGTAEAALGDLDTTPFRIVTKTIGLAHGLDAVIARARQSAKILPRADTLLVHAASDLLSPEGAQLWTALRALKDDSVFRKIGISVYIADDPATLASRFRPDVMQLPFSLLDQRLLRSGTLARLADLGVEVHARSLFLQGLLFLEQLPLKLQRAAPHLARLRAVLGDAGITPLAAALGFVLARPEIAIGLVGVTRLGELEEILAAIPQSLPDLAPDLDWAALALDDEMVLTPSLW